MPDAPLLWLAFSLLVINLLSACLLALAGLRIPRLLDFPPAEGDDLPPLSVVVAARDEERHVEEAMRSLLALDYPKLEAVAVDDRSTDRTGAILDEIAAADPRLKVVHVTELPDGWLGKCHALHVGAGRASGELILFTDADVVMEPSLLRRAVRRLTDERLDHLTAVPAAPMPGVVLPAFIAAFSIYFALFTRPWRVRNPRSGAHVGIGAFNLLRAEVYRTIGGHAAIALRPDDDLKLGKLVKRGGFRQELANGVDLMRVEWYASVGELVRGLTKNMFAGVEYRLWMVVGTTILLPLLYVWPFAGIFIGPDAARLLNLADALLILTMVGVAAARAGVRPGYAAGFPLITLLFVYILWRSTVVTLWTGGIAWRGTHYPLKQLKANRV